MKCIANEEREIFTVGHGNNSATFLPKGVGIEDMFLLDTAGLGDSRAHTINITNVVILKKVINNASSVKFLAIFN